MSHLQLCIGSNSCSKCFQCEQEVTKMCIQWRSIPTLIIGQFGNRLIPFGNVRSPRCLQIRVLLVFCCKQDKNLVFSSENTISPLSWEFNFKLTVKEASVCDVVHIAPTTAETIQVDHPYCTKLFFKLMCRRLLCCS